MTNSIWNLLEDLKKKSGITEILINGPQNVFIEKGGQFIQLNANLPAEDIKQFIKEVADLNQKLCDYDNPILDGNLPDGSRINIVNGPFVSGSPAISIRKYLKFISSFDKTPNIFGLTPRWVEFLQAIVQSRINVVVSGGTGVGKTTFLNLMINEIKKEERVIVIEDTPELTTNMPNVVRLESGAKVLQSKTTLTTRDLVKNTLRMRPDRIIIGESRGGEIFDLLQAMNTGHDGSMTSIHSSSAGECLSRMETLFLLAGFDVPMNIVRRQMSSAIQFIIQLGRDKDGARIITEIIEVCGMEGTTILIQTIATREDGFLVFKGLAPRNLDKLHRYGGLPLNFFQNM
ncbi:MAG: Flp pilus assembly complex ATPase component TadA [Bdellovibrionales bacterium]|nr:Flp pilus assembly complex ATPase component TadA [Bdellovibrionales bacterium]